jgi:drug/metabolite transporter (DMT)-like permease
VGERSAAHGTTGGIDALGFALVILSAFCYSSLAIFGKIALREQVALPSLLATRFVVASAILWALCALLPGQRAAARALRGRRWPLVLWGVFGYAGQSALFFASLQFISASLSEVLLYTCPAFLAIIVWVRTGRRPALPVQAAIALALFGTWLAAAPGDRLVSKAGALLALSAGLWYASFLLVLERITPGVPPLVASAHIITGAAAAFLLALPLAGGYALPATPAGWGAVFGLAVTPTIFGFSLFIVGMERIGSQVAAILSTFEPLGTLLLAALLLGERLVPLQWAGAALVLMAAFVLAAAPAIDRAEGAA